MNRYNDHQPAVSDVMRGDAQAEEAIYAPRMTRERLIGAMETLARYRAGKAHLESRLIEVEQWWKMRHWAWMQEKGAKDDMKTASAWLFNVIVSRHADGVQSIPEANILPREESDRAVAARLSSIIPCVLEQNGLTRCIRMCCGRSSRAVPGPTAFSGTTGN